MGDILSSISFRSDLRRYDGDWDPYLSWPTVVMNLGVANTAWAKNVLQSVNFMLENVDIEIVQIEVSNLLNSFAQFLLENNVSFAFEIECVWFDSNSYYESCEPPLTFEGEVDRLRNLFRDWSVNVWKHAFGGGDWQ